MRHDGEWVHIRRENEDCEKHFIYKTPENPVIIVKRSTVHRRKLVTTPIMSFSNDKRHDTYYVQQCLLQEVLKRGGQVYEILMENRHINHLHIDTDNAASHFKSKYTLQYFARMMKKMVEVYGREWRLSWGFGCPSHGKGCWDGFGGVIKSWTTRRIIAEELAFSPDEEGKKSLFDYIKNNFNRSNRTYKKIKDFMFTWQNETSLRPGLTERVVTHRAREERKDSPDLERQETQRVRDRKDVVNISAFGGLGSEDLFYYEVSKDSTENKPTLFVRRFPCYDKCCMGTYEEASRCPFSSIDICLLVDRE